MSFALRITFVALLVTVGSTAVALRAQESSQEVSVTGCLQRAGEEFVLVVSESQRHQVQAAPSVELAAHVDHRVELTGTVEKAENATILKATALKMIANSCTP